MSWAIGYDEHWNRDVGYGVPATCDHAGCGKQLDRGLSYVCGGLPHGGEEACGLFFCEQHGGGHQCARCAAGAEPFAPTPDVPVWMQHKLTDSSWQQWRDENPDEVAQLRALLNKDNTNG
ncbi:hypothetical protein [Stenotrophomonas sp.]|uniref:hypothetical protein n=1 Tax=Stenotrophomonas sp. TaxID=69392 RepID=UPI00289B09C7|nr:hypothetical protein [Stenotrophomonas sp.]